MSELNKILLTILGGITIFVFGQIFLKLWLEPISELRSCIGEICDSLIYYANIYSNAGLANHTSLREAEEKLRQQATLIMAKAHLILWYGFFASIKLIPHKQNIKNAHRNLIGLANGVYNESNTEGNKKRKNEVIKSLNLNIIEK